MALFKQQQCCSHKSITLCVMFMMLFVIFLVTTATAARPPTPAHVLGAINARPLRIAKINVDHKHNIRQKQNGENHQQALQQMTELSMLSFDAVSLTSQTPPLRLLDENHLPFGRYLSVQFEIGQGDGDDENAAKAPLLLSTDEEHNFLLEVDVNLISTDPTNPTANVLSTSTDYVTAIDSYAKHTSYKGTRIDKDGNEQTLLLEVVPTFRDAKASNDLETQSTTDENNDGEQKQFNGYTIEALLSYKNGKTYHISSYQSLVNEFTMRMAQFEEDQQRDGQLDENTVQSTMNVLSENINVLSTLRPLAEDDLFIRELILDGQDNTPAPCGNLDHDHSDLHLDESQQPQYIEEDLIIDENSPLSTGTKFMRKWASTCHSRMANPIVFTLRLVLSTSLRRSLSGATTEAGIVDSKVYANAKLIIGSINNIVLRQFSIIWQIGEFVNLPSSDQRIWNNDTACDMNGALSFLSTDRANGNYNQSTTHLFTGCGCPCGYSGLAFVGGVCSSSLGGVTQIVSLQSYPTVAHEMTGHQLGMPHVFPEFGGSGSLGSMMDYGLIRLIAPDPDAGEIAFSERYSARYVCPQIESKINWKNSPVKECFKDMVDAFGDDFIDGCSKDGTKHPWVECDVSTACCKDCKLANKQVNCFTPHDECCVNCQMPDKPTFCTVNGVAKAGVCQAGACKPTGGRCASLINVNDSCATDERYFYSFNAGNDLCQYVCWTDQKTCSGTPLYGSTTAMGVGSPCYVTEGVDIATTPPEIGMCMKNTTGSATVCRGKSHPEYKARYLDKIGWDYIVVQEPICAGPNNTVAVPVIDKYICRGLNNEAIGLDLCAHAPKPQAAVLDCSSKVENFIVPNILEKNTTYTLTWKYTQGKTAPKGEMANIFYYRDGDYVRQYGYNVTLTDQKLTMTVPANDGITDNGYFVIYSQSTGLRILSNSFGIYTFSYNTKLPWGACSLSTCGNGTGVRLRAVPCQNQRGEAVDARYCASFPLPELSTPCSINRACAVNQYCAINECVTTSTLCNTSTCPTRGGTCVDNVCTCKDGDFYGTNCGGSETCTFNNNTSTQASCANDGYITGTTTAGGVTTCGTTCSCVNSWKNKVNQTDFTATSQGCTECPLQCGEYGSRDQKCTKCECTASAFGSTCQCRNIQFILSFQNFPTNFTQFSNSDKYTEYLQGGAANRDEYLITQLNSYFGAVLQVYGNIINSVQKPFTTARRLKIESWTISNKKLLITTSLKSVCDGGYAPAIADVLTDGYTPVSELYYFVDTILSAFTKFNKQGTDPFGFKSLLNDPTDQDANVSDSKTLDDGVITDPKCKNEEMGNKYKCSTKGYNNAITQVLSTSVASVVIAVTIIGLLY